MADNEIKILKTNTFEEWRQKSNEVSLNVGADDRLDSRLTDRVFKHDNVSGLKLNIIDGADDDNKTQVFQLIPDTTVDNTNGYIILTDSYSIPGAFVKGATVSQTGGYSAVIESVTTIDNKPKILVKNSSGDFNASQDLSIGGTSIPNANILRLVSEAYDKASVRVLNGSTELVQGLLEANFHVPNVSGKITLAGSPDLTNFTEGTLIYQGDPSTPASASTSDIEENATWYARVYHAGSSEIYIKTHSGTYSSSVQVKVQGFTTTDAKLTAAQHSAFTVLDQTVGHVIELNKSVTANDDIKVIATDLVTAVNELQDDIGQIESLDTNLTATDLVGAVNEHEDDLYTSTTGSFSGLTSKHFKGAIEELRSELGDHNTINNNTGYGATTAAGGIVEIQNDIGDIGDIQTSHTSTLVGGINEIEEALRGTSLTNYTLNTSSSDGIVGGINEIEEALRGTSLTNYTLNTSSSDGIVGAINELFDDIHTAESVTLNTDANFLKGGINELETIVRGANAAVTNYSLDTDAHNIVDAINELEGALRGTSGNYVTWPTGTNSPHLSATDIRGAVVELGQTIGNGTITGTGTAAAGAGNLTTAINLIDTEIGSTDLPTTDQTVTGAIDELHTEIGNNDTDIGNIQTQIDGSTTVDSARAWTGLAATHISGAIQEIANTTITAGAGLTGGGNLQSNKTIDVVGATDGGITVNADSIEVDSTVIRTTTTNGQTFNQNITFTTGNTLTIPSGATLDIDGTLLIGGGAGSSLSFDTAFVTLASSATQEGIEIDRSAIDINGGVGNATSPTLDAKIQWNEGSVASKPDRAWQAVGIDDDGNALTADIVTFYNAQDLISNNTETDLTASWDATNQNFDFALKTTGVTAQQYGSTTAIPVITIDSKGRITAASTAAIVTELTFSAETNSGGSGEQKINLATETLHFDGVANQIVTEAKDNEVEFGLPSDLRAPGTLRVLSTTDSSSTSSGALRVDGGVGIAKNLHVGGNLTVSGTQTIVNSNQVNIGDAVITLNSDETGTPSENAGIEVERGTSANKTFLWNEANGQWEADGVAIVTEANDFDNWLLAASGVAGTDTITSGETVTFGVTPVDSLDGLTVTRSGSNISYGHANTSTLSGNQGLTSNGNVLQTVTVDTYGHVTGVASTDLDNRYIRSWTAKDHDGTTYPITQGDTLWFKEGGGIDVDFTADDELTITNTDRGSSQNIFKNIIIEDPDGADIQSWAADNNNDTFFIREVQVDSTSGIELTSISTGANDRMGIAHANTSSQASVNNSNNTVIQDITLDTYGHITGIASKNITTVTNAENVHVDEKNDNVNYQVMFVSSGTPGYERPYIDTDNAHFNYNPSTQLISGAKLHWNDINSKPALDNYVSWTARDNDNDDYTITSGDVLKFAEGGGIDVNFTADDVLTFTNTDKGSSQFIYKNVTAYASNGTTQRGTTQSADSNNDTLQFREQGGITLSTPANTDDVIGIAHADTSTLSGAQTTAGHAITSITVDGYGHVTAVGTAAKDNYVSWTFKEGNGEETGTISSGQTLHFEQSTGIQVEKTADRQLTFTNTAPHQATNLSWSRTASVLTVTSSTGTNVDLPAADANGPGVLTVGGHNKLSGIASGAEVNQNAISTFELGTYSASGGGGTDYAASSKTDEYRLHFWSDSFETALNSNLGTVRLKQDQKDNIHSIGPTGTANVSLGLGSGYGYFYENGSTTQVRISAGGQIDANGDVVAFSSAVGSDIKLKDNIQVVDGALEKVSQLEGVTFKWKKDGRESAGVIAQNVEEVFPRAVKEVDSMGENEGETHKVVDYNQLSALFIEAIKELKEENKELRAQIEALKDINR